MSQASKSWVTPVTAKLFHGDKLIGEITNITVEDMFQWSGCVRLTDESPRYKVMFDYFNSPEREREPEEPDEGDLPFHESFLNDWFIEDENGRREVSFPVVTPENEIFWRD